MSKDNGLGDLLYLAGRDLSGDIGAISEVSGGPAVTDTTHITKDALERIGTTLAGQLVFDAFFNPARAHIALSALPTADVVSTYLRGSAPDTPCAGLIGRQVDYPGHRGADGSLHFAITILSDGAGVEWGRGYVGGPTRSDGGATVGASVDDGAASFAGMAAYLHVLAFTGTSVTVTIEHSADDGVSDAYTTVLTFAVVSAAPNGQRVATATTTTIKRWLRVRTTGTFSAATLHVMAYRGVALGVIVAVDVQVFTSSGTWTKPTSGQTVTFVIAIGGGAGGGRGVANNVALSGGTGGGGGAYSSQLFPIAALAATETVLVGAAGSGAAAPSGNATAGGSSKFGTVVKVTSFGGNLGPNGSNVGKTGGTGGGGEQVGSNGGDSNLGGTGNAGQVLNLFSASGGGAGGGHDATPTGFNGGNGGASVQSGIVGFGGAGTVGTNGGDATGTTPNTPNGGQGGGGGGGAGAANAGNGGAGGIYGGGGGGGGSCAAGFTAGSGGAGAPGIVVAVSW